MSLIGKLVDKLLTKGSITLKQPGKPPDLTAPFTVPPQSL